MSNTLFLRTHAALVSLIVLSVCVSGCLVVRTSENRIRLDEDGSGEAVLRLIDIRSDAVTDSGITADFNSMMTDYDRSSGEEFERDGRKITSRHFTVHGDTLIATITYTFPSLGSVEGLRVTGDEMFFVVEPGREVVSTNGSTRSGEGDRVEIVWDHDARYLVYQVREKSLPPSVSLASRYTNYLK